MQPFDQAVNQPIVPSSGNNQQSSSSTFNINDAEIMKSSLDTTLIQDFLLSLSVPQQILEVNASEGTYCEPPADRVSVMVPSMPAHPVNTMGSED